MPAGKTGQQLAPFMHSLPSVIVYVINQWDVLAATTAS
jgi:hypothetical protein